MPPPKACGLSRNSCQRFDGIATYEASIRNNLVVLAKRSFPNGGSVKTDFKILTLELEPIYCPPEIESETMHVHTEQQPLPHSHKCQYDIALPSNQSLPSNLLCKS